MTTSTLRRGACAGVGALAAVLLVAGCGNDITPRAVPEADATFSSPTNAPGQEGEDLGGDIDFDAEIGDCVLLGGTKFDATIEAADCGSDSSNFKVIAKVPTQDRCPGDVDQSYYETYGDVEQGALCLDIDWVVGGCIDLGSEDPVRVDCTEPLSESYRVTDVLAGTTDVDDCADPATGGFRYFERDFVVCFEDL